MAYVSNKLIHWVGRGKSTDEQYNILTQKILKHKELLYSKCDWKYGSKYGGIKNAMSVPMICFTDIPFSETERHCMNYSRFGLSFEKYYLVNCLACPVGYDQHPFLHNNYSYIMKGLHALKALLDQKGIAAWKSNEVGSEDKEYSLHEMLKRFQFMMLFRENYSRKEYQYNEVAEQPHEHQVHFFEQPDALYFEREWRMILSDSAKNLKWNRIREDLTYFHFNEKYLSAVIVPREHIDRLKTEWKDIFFDFHPNQLPNIIGFEDLKYM